MKIISYKLIKSADSVEFVEVTSKQWFYTRADIAYKRVGDPFWRWLESGEFANELDDFVRAIKKQKSRSTAQQLFNKT